MSTNISAKITTALVAGLALLTIVSAQKSDQKTKPITDTVRTMTIPVSIFTQKELKEKRAEEYLETGELTVKEDGDEQTILSIRTVSNTPLSLAVLIQEDLDSSVNNQLRDLAEFIRRMPSGSRVMVGYLGSGSIRIRQKFTTNLEKAAKSLRIVSSSEFRAPRSPYDGVNSALRRFEGIPNGRRAILLLSDGLDVSNGFRDSTPASSNSLSSAILNAQRRSVAVYSFYSSATYTGMGSQFLISNGQGSLNRISNETGGRAFFSGSFTPVSYAPFFRDLNLALTRQLALTYLSTHMKHGYHKVKVRSSNPEIRIDHPKGYYYRKRR